MISYNRIPCRMLAAFVIHLALGMATTAVSAENNGITVVGSGTVEARPDTVVMSGAISAEAELADDAIIKFESNKRRALEALVGLGIKTLMIKESGISIKSTTYDAQAAQMAAMRGEAPPDLGSKISVNESLEIRLTGISEMDNSMLMKAIASVLNTSKDVGLEVGPPAMNMLDLMRGGKQPSSLAIFKISNTDALERTARERAMKDAREAGKQLAELAGAELGKVVSVSQGSSGDEEGVNSSGAYMAMIMGAGNGPDDNDEFTSETFQNIPITINLRVNFELN